MSMLRRLPLKSRQALLHRLFEQLAQSDELRAVLPGLIESAAEEEQILLSPEELALLYENTPDFLFGVEPPQPQDQPAEQAPIAHELEQKIMAHMQQHVAEGSSYSDIEAAFIDALAAEQITLSRSQKRRLFEKVTARLFGFGPLEPLLSDDSVSEILVIGPKQVFVTRNGEHQLTDVKFDGNIELLQIIDRMAATTLDTRELPPLVTWRYRGLHLHAVLPIAVSLSGPVLHLLKGPPQRWANDDYLRFGVMTPDVLELLQTHVEQTNTILITGRDHTGKTTLLNTLCHFIPDNRRIVTIEDEARLQLRQPEVIPLQAQPPEFGAITIDRLAIHALRLRPDYLVIDPLNSEAFSILVQTRMPYMGVIPATSIEFALQYLLSTVTSESLVQARFTIVHMDYITAGLSKITRIASVEGDANGKLDITDLFRFQGDNLTGQLERVTPP